MSFKTLLFSFLLLIPLSYGDAGDKRGNGGDPIRFAFIKTGEAVISYLENSDAGKKLAADSKLSLTSLKQTLTIRVITLTEEKLKNPKGIEVNEFAEKGKIVLQKKPWFDAFSSEKDVYSLVFQLMLKAADYPDEKDEIASALKPFPEKYKVSTKSIIARDTSHLPYAERILYLIQRSRKLLIRSLDQPNEIEKIRKLITRLGTEFPDKIKPEDEKVYQAKLDEIEKGYNEVEDALLPERK